MRQLYFLFLLPLLFSSSFAAAQTIPPAIVNQACFGGTDTDYFRGVTRLSDAGYLTSIRTGSTDGDLTGEEEVFGWVKKFDSNLVEQWERFYGGEPCFLTPIKAIEWDSSLYFFGLAGQLGEEVCDVAIGKTDFLMMKTDLEGELIWYKLYGSPGTEGFSDVMLASDTSFLVTGYSLGSGGDIPFHYGSVFGEDIIVFKLTLEGDMEWLKVLGGSAADVPKSNSVEVIPGEYIINGIALSEDHDLAGSGIDFRKNWMIKLNAAGELIDERFIDGTNDIRGYSNSELIYVVPYLYEAVGVNPESSILPDLNGIGGNSDGGIAVYDPLTLELIDLKLFGGTDFDILKRIVYDSTASLFYLFGYSDSDDGDLPSNYNNTEAEDYWVICLNKDLEKVWSRNLGGSAADNGFGNFEGFATIINRRLTLFTRSVAPETLPDHDITCSMGGYGDVDAWIVAFDTTVIVEDTLLSNTEFLVSPNPADQFIKIILPTTQGGINYSISLLDQVGRVIIDTTVSNSETILDVSFLPAGLYFLIAKNAYKMYEEKIVIQH